VTQSPASHLGRGRRGLKSRASALARTARRTRLRPARSGYRSTAQSVHRSVEVSRLRGDAPAMPRRQSSSTPAARSANGSGRSSRHPRSKITGGPLLCRCQAHTATT
jgi:hypothetical protein